MLQTSRPSPYTAAPPLPPEPVRPPPVGVGWWSFSHADMQTSMHAQIHTCMHRCMHLRHACVHTCVHTFRHACIHA